MIKSRFFSVLAAAAMIGVAACAPDEPEPVLEDPATEITPEPVPPVTEDPMMMDDTMMMEDTMMMMDTMTP